MTTDEGLALEKAVTHLTTWDNYTGTTGLLVAAFRAGQQHCRCGEGAHDQDDQPSRAHVVDL